MDEYDYIIVGGGSAGCVLSERLSRAGRDRVLVIEAGGTDRRIWIRMPIGYGKSFYDPKVNWRYRSEPDPGLGGRASYWPRGKVLGGSSSINAMVYCRGLPGDFDDWRSAGNPGWGWNDVQPVFERIEKHVLADGSTRGSGPLCVSHREPEYHPVRRHFYAAAREVGLPITADLNGPEPEGVGPYAITTKDGWRCSAVDAFLRPAMGRANLEVLTRTLAARVLFEGRRAVGVEVWRDGLRQQFRARREVILAAGAVNSPQLLQLSGIGPGAQLQRLGVDVVHANDAVGGNLQDHLAVSYFYRATEPTLNSALGTWRGRIAAGLAFLVSRSGPFSLSVNQMGGLVRSAPGQPRPDMQLYFNPLSYTTEHVGKRPLMKPDPYPGFILSFNPCRPSGTGRIDIRSPDPTEPPTIAANSLSTEEDVLQVIAGGRLIGRLQATQAMRMLIDGVPGFDVARATDEEIVTDFRARSGTVFHACGTCRMAPVDAGGVVDASLKVFGVDALRVIDASVFPNITSANTNAPTMMVAHKAADTILGEGA